MLKRIKVQAWECRCERCGHRWLSVGKHPPRACAGCKAIHWHRAPKTAKAAPAKRQKK